MSKAPRLSILDAGQDNNPVHGVAYLKTYGFSDLKTEKRTRKQINLTGVDVQNRPIFSNFQKNEWLFSELLELSEGVDNFSLPDDDIHDYSLVLGWCLYVLSQSPSAALMVREVVDGDWRIGLDDLHGGEYCIDVEQKLLLLDNNTLVPSALGRSNYFRNVTIVTLVKALRDIWQEKRHGGFDECYRPEHIMTLERVRAADCVVLSVLVGWELRSEDYSDIWRHLIGSENGDMAMTFSAHMEREPTSLFNGRALKAAFRQWFKDDGRVNSCDHDTLEYLDDVLAESHLSNPFGVKKPSKMNVEVLSCLPDKTAYLQGMGGEILADPLYCGMDDAINQSHLFHILYDLEAVIVENVPFRDADLARRIFPDEMIDV